MLEDGEPRPVASLACTLSNAGQLKGAVCETIAGLVRRSVGTRHEYDLNSLALIGHAGWLATDAAPHTKRALLEAVASSFGGAIDAAERWVPSGGGSAAVARPRVQDALSSLAFACSRCGIDDPRVYSRITRAVIAPAMTPEQLTKTLWAFTNAGVVDPELSANLAADMLRRLRTAEGQAEVNDVHLSAFARALALQAQAQHVPVFNKIFELAASRSASGMHPVARSKLYMAHLVATKLGPLRGAVTGLPAELVTQFRDPFVATKVVVSSFHKQIVSILRVLRVPHAVEALMPCGLRVDVLLPDAGLAIEVDGPWHFLPSRVMRRPGEAPAAGARPGPAIDAFKEAVRGREDDARLNLATRVKRDVLRAEGLTVIGVPFFEWMNLRTQSERHDAVISALHASGAQIPVAVFAGTSEARNRVTFTNVPSHMPAGVESVPRRRR
jgi:hypothetical protein